MLYHRKFHRKFKKLQTHFYQNQFHHKNTTKFSSLCSEKSTLEIKNIQIITIIIASTSQYIHSYIAFSLASAFYVQRVHKSAIHFPLTPSPLPPFYPPPHFPLLVFYVFLFNPHTRSFTRFSILTHSFSLKNCIFTKYFHIILWIYCTIHVCVQIYVFIFVCICVCECVCAKCDGILFLRYKKPPCYNL